MAGQQAAGNAGGSPQHTPKPDLFFEDADRPATNALIALTGPASSGKTQSALAMATGMGTKIGVCDTERGRASHYARLFPFKHLRMPDYAPQTLIKALAQGAAQGIDVMVIDSGSPYWSGKAGVLDQVDNKTEASRSKNAFTSGWKSIKPVEHDMWEAIMAYPGHVIMTLRVKTAYELVDNNGKKEPTKIGLKPDQRGDVEYEFDIVGDMDMGHSMTVSKCSFPGLWEPGQRIELPNTQHGADIVKWLSEGTRLTTIREYVDRVMDPAFTYQQLRNLYQGELSQRGLLGAAMFDPETNEQTTLGNLVIRLGVARNPAPEGAATTRAAAAADQTEMRKAG
ncbi:AAA domain-containing protein [Streptomyces sp. Ag109_O5-1]|uniref:AAA family ATPase n=1 Tax=Streptomyces sp. Ag109_O5-1 TaxID=1938851 RepID=UPI000F4D5AD2|nr:AAA family ATPase [Streptomyces sp. Ag109_O5-1]RPE39700.1 AAA domain-containing protein [Streptomyces sp. Ag109_O5-1]